MKAIKSILVLVIVLFWSSEISAQFRYQYLKIGVSGGATNYLGDLDDDLTFKFALPGVGAHVAYRFNPLLSGRLTFFQGWMAADDKRNTNPDRFRRNLHFRSQVREVSAQLVIDFIPTTRRYVFRPSMVPYIFGGLAVFSFNPQARFNGQWVDLQPLGTEGQFLPDPANVYPEPYNLTQISIPMGAGLRFSLGKRWDLEVEAGWRKTFTDYLDDVSGLYPDAEELRASIGQLAVLSDPDNVAAINGIRGDNTQDDWYIYTNISVSYILDWVKCPTFR